MFDGGPGKDGIPALSNPRLVAAGASGAAYLGPEDRVIGFTVAGEPIAVPLNIGWWHEIVNLDLGGHRLAITYCPLTGSGLGFDRSKVDNAEFVVSGLLFMNNLIMYDRRGDESLWPQVSRGARCGTRMGTDLDMIPVIEMTWEGWVTLYPTTRVVSSETGFLRDYNAYPYGNYDEPDNASLLFPMPRVDTRRPPKEHVADGSGLDLYRAVAAARPDLVHRWVFMTGDVLGSDIATFLRETQALHLSKPFEMSDLLSTLERAAGSQPALVGAVGPAG